MQLTARNLYNNYDQINPDDKETNRYNEAIGCVRDTAELACDKVKYGKVVGLDVYQQAFNDMRPGSDDRKPRIMGLLCDN
jgi:hypothetical protein